ncbi:MAG: alpha-amylase, partial [Chlorobiales bacterium]|nr:alpha-amylase [Chlorobiales bacterium]
SPDLLAVMRKGREKNLLFVGNSNSENNASGYMEFHQKSFTLTDMVSGNTYPVNDHRLQLETGPGNCLLFEVPL